MSDFDTDKHPRGHASNPGAFSDKPNSEPEAGLASDPSATAFLNDVAGREDRIILRRTMRNIGIQSAGLTGTQADDMEAIFDADMTRVYAAAEALGQLKLGGLTGDDSADAWENGPRTWIAALTARALAARRLIGAPHGWTQEAYDTITRPWRSVVGPIHPDDEAIPASWSKHAAGSPPPAGPYLKLAAAIRGS